MAKKRVLIIEDETDLVELLRLRLGAAGYEISAAFDGKEGLEKAKGEKPDLVLLDIVLPGLDGFAVCRALKESPVTENIPVVVVSASGGKNLPQRSFAAGADEVIIKPFETQELLDKIKKLLK